ncbi:MAG: hypothetical protein IPP40_09150 [bacterium]|nr:hypothetical protein [bacterium]
MYSARASHVALIDQYIAEKRAALDSFMVQQWVPTFMSNGLEDSGLLDSIQNAATERERADLPMNSWRTSATSPSSGGSC